jgi:PKD repeat protein
MFSLFLQTLRQTAALNFIHQKNTFRSMKQLLITFLLLLAVATGGTGLLNAQTLPGNACETCRTEKVSIVQLAQTPDCRYYFDLVNESGCTASTILWTFGDGVGASGQNPSHLYAFPGTYTVTATVSLINATGGTCTVVSTFTVVNTCTGCGNCNLSNISLTQQQGADCRYYFDVANNSGCQLSSVLWTFGDGTSSSGWNTNHLYNFQGTYTVTAVITVTNPAGGTCTTTKTLTVTNTCTPPAPCGNCNLNNISLTQQQGADCRYYFDVANNSGCQLSSVLWTFGDGTSSSGWNTNHLYNFQGTYTVTAVITVTNSTGGTCTTTKTLTVTNNCTPSCGNCNLNNISLTQQQGADCRYYFDVTNNSGCQLSSVLWTFGDGTSSSGWNTNHLYNLQGTYTVTAVITVTNSTGGTCTTTKTLTVTNTCTPPSPCANCNTSNVSIVLLPSPVCWYTFGISNNSGCQLSSVLWNFGDGATASGWNASHQYNFSGTYTVTAVITLNNGLGGTCVTTKTFVIQATACGKSALFKNIDITSDVEDGKLHVAPTVVSRGGNATATWGEAVRISELRIIDLQGREVAKIAVGDAHEATIDIPASLNAGIYILMSDAPKAGTVKIVVQ